MAKRKKATEQKDDERVGAIEELDENPSPLSHDIRTHEVNGLNESIAIRVLDEQGPGGAFHQYSLDVRNPGTEGVVARCKIGFQKGPIREAGYNGITNEALLAVVRHRLECFQHGPFATAENGNALKSIVEAMDHLATRTRERVSRGVEGTHQV